MDKKQSRTMDSQVKSQSQLNQNAPVFVGFSQYPKLKAQIDTGITKALDLSKKKLYYESLTSAPKTNSRSTLVNASLNLSGKMESLSIINENPQLYDSVKITKSSIKLLNDGLFLQKCELLAEAAEDNETDLEEYGETPATIADYKNLIATFSAEVSNMADIAEQLGNVTEEFAKQLKQNEKVFKKVDSLVNTMSESQPEFYNMYFSARSQKPTGGSKVTAKVKVYDALTNQPLPGATLIVEMTGNTKALASGADLVKNVKVRSAGGGVDLKALPPGVYTFSVNYYGYTQQTITVYVNEGVLSKVDFPLNKLD
jgi:hypothetical protein